MQVQDRPLDGANWREPLLYYALIFLVIALIAAAFGYGGIASTAAGVAKILFFVFLVLFLITFISGVVTATPLIPLS